MHFSVCSRIPPCIREREQKRAFVAGDEDVFTPAKTNMAENMSGRPCTRDSKQALKTGCIYKEIVVNCYIIPLMVVLKNCYGKRHSALLYSLGKSPDVWRGKRVRAKRNGIYK